MALKINLKDGESVFFGTSKVTAVHDGGYTILVIEGGEQPVMKESEVVTLDEADTPEKSIYYHLRQHYLSGDQGHMQIAEAIAKALSDEDFATYQKAIADIRAGRAFAGLRTIRRIAGI